MNKSRFIFYLLISFLLGLIDFLKDVKEEESVLEALEFVPIVIPMAFVFILAIYHIRAWTFRDRTLKKYTLQDTKDSTQWIFYIVSILTQTFIYTSIVALLGKLFYPNYTTFGITSVFFWANFLIIFSVISFVYIIEAFLDSESRKKEIEIKLSKIENESITAKYLSLKNQLNPHFLFNSFNSLSALMSIDINKADIFLQHLSNVYRYNLTHSEELVVSIANELELIKSYMKLQSIRFRESIEINYLIDNSKVNHLVPPMTLELLVENAIKHNIVEKANPLKISIETERDYIVVKNNFQPRRTAVNKELSLGIGLKNLKNQYELIYTEIPTFKVEYGQYVVRIPLIKPYI